MVGQIPFVPIAVHDFLRGVGEVEQVTNFMRHGAGSVSLGRSASMAVTDEPALAPSLARSNLGALEESA